MQEEKKAKDGKELELTEKVRKNPWIISTIVLGIFALVLLFFLFKGGVTGNVISEKEIGEKAVSFINSQLLQGQGEVTLDSVSVKNGLYEVMVDFNGKKVPTYFTKDGEYFVGTQIISLTGSVLANLSEEEEPEKIVKSDKPKVELFVMTHCPYGVKAQEILVPVMKLFGNSADIKTRFVSYAMHGKTELDDNTIEYCIQKEQPTKFADFLSCFVQSENSTQCISQASINKGMLTACISATDAQYKITAMYNNQSTWLSGRYPVYPVDSALNEQYGVQGSENLIINGVSISPSKYRWDSNKLKEIICSAFNTPPSECSQTLTATGTTAPSSGSCG